MSGPEATRPVCLVEAGYGIGDVIEATPACHALWSLGFEVDLLVNRPEAEGVAALFRGHPALRRVLTDPTQADPRAYDFAVGCNGPAEVVRRMPRPTGFPVTVGDIYRHGLLGANLSVARALGFEGAPPPCTLNLDVEPSGIAPRTVVVHAGSDARRPFKRWPHWEPLCDRIRDLGHPVVVVGTESDRSQNGWERRHDARFGLPLTRLVAVLRDAHLYLGNDSGIGHLAGAVGAPGLLLFGPTDPRIYAPNSAALRVLDAPAKPGEGRHPFAPELPVARAARPARGARRGHAPARRSAARDRARGLRATRAPPRGSDARVPDSWRDRGGADDVRRGRRALPPGDGRDRARRGRPPRGRVGAAPPGDATRRARSARSTSTRRPSGARRARSSAAVARARTCASPRTRDGRGARSADASHWRSRADAAARARRPRLNRRRGAARTARARSASDASSGVEATRPVSSKRSAGLAQNDGRVPRPRRRERRLLLDRAPDAEVPHQALEHLAHRRRPSGGHVDDASPGAGAERERDVGAHGVPHVDEVPRRVEPARAHRRGAPRRDGGQSGREGAGSRRLRCPGPDEIRRPRDDDAHAALGRRLEREPGLRRLRDAEQGRRREERVLADRLRRRAAGSVLRRRPHEQDRRRRSERRRRVEERGGGRDVVRHRGGRVEALRGAVQVEQEVGADAARGRPPTRRATRGRTGARPTPPPDRSPARPRCPARRAPRADAAP